MVLENLSSIDHVYEVNLVFALPLRPLRELALLLLFCTPLRAVIPIIGGGGALNHGLTLLAVVTDHSPFFAGAATTDGRELTVVMLLPVFGLAVLVPERTEDRRADWTSPCVYLVKSLGSAAEIDPDPPFGPKTASAANLLYSAFSIFLRCFSSFSARFRSSFSSLAISLADRCDTSLRSSIPASGEGDALGTPASEPRC